MKPWIIDAGNVDTLDSLEEIEKFQHSALHITPDIETFIGGKDFSRTIVSAPKGGGKTLLLKARRNTLRKIGGFRLLPDGRLLDRPGAAMTPPFSGKKVEVINNDREFWLRLWEVSICASVIKKMITDIPKFKTPELNDFFQDQYRNNATEIFFALLRLDYGEYTSLFDDFTRLVLPRYMHIHEPVAVFIDDVDSTFEAHLLQNDIGSGVLQGVTDSSYWYTAQIGLAHAVYSLHTANNHIKIYAAIRKEAYELLTHSHHDAARIRAHIFDLTYETSDLDKIFEKNIELEPKDNLVVANTPDPLKKFFGKDVLKMPHSFTGEYEDILSYLKRHSLARPRDIAVLGEHLSALSPSGRNAKTIKTAVNLAANVVAQTYLTESLPHIRHLNLDNMENFLELITHNILSFQDVVSISERFNESVLGYLPKRDEEAYMHVFCDLYRVGLLGTVRRTPAGELQQFFPQPGQKLFQADGRLPTAQFYVIHSVLDDYIDQLNNSYLDNVDTTNIIGHLRPWRDFKDDFRFVIKGDIVRSSEIHTSDAMGKAMHEFFKNIVAEETAKLEFGKVSDGDSVFLIDRNPSNLIQSVKRILARMKSSPFARHLRCAGDHGLVVYDKEGEPEGSVLRNVSRMEPFGKSGKLLLSHIFRERLKDLNVHYEKCRKIVPEDEYEIPFEKGHYNLKKNEFDEDIFMELYHYNLEDD